VSSAAGFLTARELIGSRVEFLDVDLFDLSPDRHGTFDVVLFLGVLYHLRHPLLALDTLAAICTEQLIVETVVTPTPQSVRARLSRALAQDQYESAPSMAFFESDEINHDPTTWWAPSVPCLTAMLRSCGFENVETVWAEGDRAIVRGYHPRLTGAGEALVAKYGAARVADAYAHVTATPAPAQLAQALGALTIREYGRVKQHAIEATAREWHQHTRWTSQ
jgi:tRNA (mo5U34)-methyltransferase